MSKCMLSLVLILSSKPRTNLSNRQLRRSSSSASRPWARLVVHQGRETCSIRQVSINLFLHVGVVKASPVLPEQCQLVCCVGACCRKRRPKQQGSPASSLHLRALLVAGRNPEGFATWELIRSDFRPNYYFIAMPLVLFRLRLRPFSCSSHARIHPSRFGAGIPHSPVELSNPAWQCVIVLVLCWGSWAWRTSLLRDCIRESRPTTTHAHLVRCSRLSGLASTSQAARKNQNPRVDTKSGADSRPCALVLVSSKARQGQGLVLRRDVWRPVGESRTPPDLPWGPVSSCINQLYYYLTCVVPHGQIATQLWSTFTGLEDKGQVYPKNEWSIHGLWPDFCNGSYTQYCDFSRQYDPRPSPNTTDGQPGGVPVPAYQGESIEKWFEPYGKLDLLAYMRKHWVSQHDSNWVFWAHEFSKHATCFSTFQKECYGPKASEHDDLFDFFETAVAWQRRLPSFQWLSDAGIRPSNTTGYTFSAVRHALTRAFGQPPFLGCGGPKYNETRAGRGSNDSGRTEINEIWYYYHVNGTPQRGDARKLNADEAGGRLTTCALAPGAIKYYERAEGSEEGDLSAEMMEM